MNLYDLKNVLEEVDIPVAYDHFDRKDPQMPPFLCYIETGSNETVADGVTYAVFPEVRVELYAARRDLELEKRVEDALTGAQLAWHRETDYLGGENMQMTTYDFTLR